MGLNLMRNFVKRIGAELLLEDLSRQLRDVDILIWDEGSVHAAHNLFVHPDTAPVLEEIVTFAALVPKPDCLIWVTAPTAQSTRVLTRRGHRRVGTNVDSAQAFAEHASTTFQALAEVPELKKRIYCISNLALGDVPSEEVLHARAQEVGAYLLRALRAMRDPPQPEGVARCLIA
jgi:hypothetical protein